MIRSSLYDYCDAYILVKETITIENTGAVATPNNRNEKVIFKNCGLIFKNCAPFTECISEISNK